VLILVGEEKNDNRRKLFPSRESFLVYIEPETVAWLWEMKFLG